MNVITQYVDFDYNKIAANEQYPLTLLFICPAPF